MSYNILQKLDKALPGSIWQRDVYFSHSWVLSYFRPFTVLTMGETLLVLRMYSLRATLLSYLLLQKIRQELTLRRCPTVSIWKSGMLYQSVSWLTNSTIRSPISVKRFRWGNNCKYAPHTRFLCEWCLVSPNLPQLRSRFIIALPICSVWLRCEEVTCQKAFCEQIPIRVLFGMREKTKGGAHWLPG